MTSISSKPDLDLIGDLPLYKQVEQHLESLIIEKNLKPGDPIPSLGDLTRQFNVNNLTIRRAIRELAARRMVVTRQGRGTYVAEGAVRRILWISGLDPIGSSTSTYYRRLLGGVSSICNQRGFEIEPVWVPRNQSNAMARYLPEIDNLAYVGFFLSACSTKHPLLVKLNQCNRAFVDMSHYQPDRRRGVMLDLHAGDELMLDYLSGAGFTATTCFSCGIFQEFEIIAKKRNIKADVVYPDEWASAAGLEQWSYETCRQLLSTGRLAPSICVTDEIIARGVTRALLAARANQDIKVMVRTTWQDAIDFGWPVTYIVYDLDEQCRMAAKVLMDQIDGKVMRPNCYLCKPQFVAPDQIEKLYQIVKEWH